MDASYWAGEQYAMECQDRWLMVQRRAMGTQQCPGDDGRHVCRASLEQAEGPRSAQDG